MAGLLYKEFVLCKKALLLLLGVAAVATAYMIFNSLISDDEELTIIYAVLYFIVFFLTGFAQNEMFTRDENAKWSSFVISTPKAAKGQVQCKYYASLILNIFVVSWAYLMDSVNAALGSSSLIIVIPVLFCGQLLINALEFPFSIRFGSKRGSNIKMGIVIAIFLAFVIYGLFGDISFIMTDDFPEKLATFLTGEGLSNTLLWILGVLPYAAYGLYYLSCKLSEKLYLKGVECYDE